MRDEWKGMRSMRQTGKGKAACAATLAAVVLAAALAGCAVQSAESKSDPAPAASKEEPTSEVEPAPRETAESAEAQREDAAQPAEEQPPSDLSDRMPYAGMPEAWIDATYMGPHEAVDASGATTTYKWYSRNGKHDLIYAAYCKGGAVDHVAQMLTATDYWPGIVCEKPDFYAEGVPESPVVDEKPDPADYDDEDDYASAAEDWYLRHGVDDPDAAVAEDWEENANW